MRRKVLLHRHSHPKPFETFALFVVDLLFFYEELVSSIGDLMVYWEYFDSINDYKTLYITITIHFKTGKSCGIGFSEDGNSFSFSFEGHRLEGKHRLYNCLSQEVKELNAVDKSN